MKHSLPFVSVHLIVKDGEKYIRACLSHIKSQTYQNVRFRIFNNASSDKTVELAKSIMPGVEIVSFPRNYGLGGGFNRSLSWSNDPYVVGLCVDVMLEARFIEEAVSAAERDPRIGVVQGKVMGYDYKSGNVLSRIDTAGMSIFRSRRIINRGHGEEDTGQYEKAGEIFCYEGAVPFFRRAALEEVALPVDYQRSPMYPPSRKATADLRFSKGSALPHQENLKDYLDEDFFWYADEVDLGWRLRHAGWKCWYEPKAMAAHDRQTTKTLSAGWKDFIALRKTIPAQKRMLDFRNQRLAFIKNDYPFSLLKDLRFWLSRELKLFAYFLFFERSTLRAYPDILRMAPRMLAKRRIIMNRRKVGRKEMEKWFE